MTALFFFIESPLGSKTFSVLVLPTFQQCVFLAQQMAAYGTVVCMPAGVLT